jgi:hypothetical protein
MNNCAINEYSNIYIMRDIINAMGNTSLVEITAFQKRSNVKSTPLKGFLQE